MLADIAGAFRTWKAYRRLRDERVLDGHQRRTRRCRRRGPGTASLEGTAERTEHLTFNRIYLRVIDYKQYGLPKDQA